MMRSRMGILVAALFWGCSGSGSTWDASHPSDGSTGLDAITDAPASPDTATSIDTGSSDVTLGDTLATDTTPADGTTTVDVPATDAGTSSDVTDVTEAAVRGAGAPVCPPPACTSNLECQVACTPPFVGAWCCESNVCVADSHGCPVATPDAGTTDASRCTTGGQCSSAADCPVAGDRCCPALPGTGLCGSCVSAHGFCPG